VPRSATSANERTCTRSNIGRSRYARRNGSELVVSVSRPHDAGMRIDLSGLWVPLVTPFDPEGRVDGHALRRLATRVLDHGARGLVALGTTGEPATLDASERAAVVDVCAEVVATAGPGAGLIVGAGSNDTAGTIAEIRRLCARAEVTAALVVVPYYTRPSEAAIVDHFGLVADASPVPIVAYNVPYRTGASVGAEAWARIGSHPNVAGLKQAVGALDHDTLELLRRRVPGFEVLAGDDAFIGPAILMGATGAIAAAAHLRTADFAALVAAARVGDVATTRRLAEALLPLVHAGFAEPNPALWKAALHADGEIATPAVRRPLTAASPEATAEVLAAVRG
jgi:4-hydroxy-tetrahydrodipicolinate synthase